MTLMLKLAGFPVRITASESAPSALSFCRSYFKGFTGFKGGTARGNKPAAAVTLVRAVRPGRPSVDRQRLEHRMSVPQLLQRVGRDTPFAAGTLCAGCMDGCLAYHPPTRSARIFLCSPAPGGCEPLYRLMWLFLALALGDLGCFFVHAAAVAGGGCGYLFFGDSGAGKTTVAAGAGSGVVLADDGPLVCREAGAGFAMHASPYHQLPGQRDRRDFPAAGAAIHALYFLDKTGRFRNRRVSPSQAVPVILQRFIHFWDYLSPAARKAAFDLFGDACHILPLSYLTVPLGTDALALVNGLHAEGR